MHSLIKPKPKDQIYYAYRECVSSFKISTVNVSFSFWDDIVLDDCNVNLPLKNCTFEDVGLQNIFKI